ncbi:biofilm formation regulator SiaD modulator protein SiaC [Desulfuromonas carbonis]|uniref:biofilm regulation phosphoprotein SiaC n=1 Tax=Desulfuromonas sp. DDH964 TaxID=1823759 RepID=UPI00078E8247|nr:biofilm regulation phosphoprotein SiaC [Desulfuromonas sp. DDH964]AMV73276.1 hypothetical protein DBW_2967 [Desulfuromonas sp. DDH964]
MEKLHVAATKSTPEVLFDPETGELQISGESFPENSFEFYKPILSWISRFLAVERRPVVLTVHFIYLNTGSTKCIMDILDLFEEAHVAGRSVEIRWQYDAENDRALETAEEFREEVTLPFRILAIDTAS